MSERSCDTDSSDGSDCDSKKPTAFYDLSHREVRSLRRWAIEKAMDGPAGRGDTREVIEAAQAIEAYVLAGSAERA